MSKKPINEYWNDRPLPKLQRSSNYDDFVCNDVQREISKSLVKALVEAMLAWGFLPSLAIHVYRDGGKYVIVEGHHRYLAAMQLGIPLIFIVMPKEFNGAIGPINDAMKKWGSKDFIRMFAKYEDEDYQTLLSYIQREIPPTLAAAMLAGNTGAGGVLSNTIKSGNFKVKTTKDIDILTALVESLDGSNKVVSSNVFMSAVAKLLAVDEFKVSVLRKKLHADPKALVKCATCEQMLDHLDEIYNFRSRKRIPIAFLAREAAKGRCGSTRFGAKRGK